MKTTVDIPDEVLDEALHHSQASTKREAIVTAIEDYNRRQRMVQLLKHAGSCDGLMSAEDLQAQRRKAG